MAFQVELSGKGFIALLILIGTVAVGIPVFLYLPSATISLTPAVASRTVTQEISLATQATAPDFVTFTLPAKVVEKELEDSKTFERQAGEIREDYAKGKVRLINEQDEEQPLLPKTHLRHEATGVQFLTDNAVRIPPQGEVEVGVTAKEVGESGNVAAGKFIVDKLPASAQSVIYAQGDTAFTGGVATDAAISEAEISQAKEEVKNSLIERAQGELTLAAGGAAIPSQLVSLEAIEETSSAEPGSFATSFTVRVKVRARAFVVSQNDLLSLSLIALRASATSEEEFVKYNPETFSPKILQADFARGTARVEGALSGTFAQKIEPSVFAPEKLAGLGKQETIEYFTAFPSVGAAEVNFAPFWVSSVPSRPSAIEISVRN